VAAQNQPESLHTLKTRVGGLTGRGASPERIRQARAELDAAVAERALDDPAALARGAAIVRAALARQLLTLADLNAGPGNAAT
jgi:hypothetical protein